MTIAAAGMTQAVADTGRLLGIAGNALGDGAHAFRTGNITLGLREAQYGEPAGLCRLTFGVADLARAQEHLSRCGLASEVGPDGDALLDKDATHGLPIALTARHDIATSNAPSDISLDHVVIRTSNPERAIALYGGRLGLDMRLDRSNSTWNARLLFFRCGDLVVEVAHVLSDGVSDAPDTFGGLSWRVPDIEAVHARLTADGFDLSPVRTGRRPGSRVCTLRNHNAGVPTILLGVTPRN